MSQLNTLKLLMIALLFGIMSLTLISAMAGTAVDTQDVIAKADSALSVSALGDSCSHYLLGDTGPDKGKVFYVDGSGCHGLEAQVVDAANAWYQSLSFGYQNFNYKSTPYLVRAVRAF